MRLLLFMYVQNIFGFPLTIDNSLGILPIKDMMT